MFYRRAALPTVLLIAPPSELEAPDSRPRSRRPKEPLRSPTSTSGAEEPIALRHHDSQRWSALRATLPEPGALRSDFGPLGLPSHLLRRGRYADWPAPGRARDDRTRLPCRSHRPFCLSEEEVALLSIERQYSDPDDTTYLRFSQTVEGIPVLRGLVQFAFDPEGRMLQVGVADVLPGLNVDTQPLLSD